MSRLITSWNTRSQFMEGGSGGQTPSPEGPGLIQTHVVYHAAEAFAQYIYVR